MKKSYRKFATLLLGVVTALSIAVPTFAAPASDYALLNVRYAPNGKSVNSTEKNPVVFTAYKIATAELKGDKYVYTATEAFRDSGVDVNEILNGGQITDNSADQRELINKLGSYINKNGEAIQEKAAKDDIRTAETETKVIKGTATDGVAQFKGLADGLYLVSSASAYWIGGTRYTAVPFLVNIPYVYNGVTNNYLTASVKFSTYTPGGGTVVLPSPSPSAQPSTPPSAVPSTVPTTAPSPEPVPSEVPSAEPVPPEEEEFVEILDEDVPLADLPIDEEIVEIEEPDVPLAELPQTGLLWWPVPVLAMAGIGFIALGVIFRKKENYDQ